MEVKKAELIDGVYSWDCDISKEEWIAILEDKSLIKEEYKSVLYKFYLEPRHRSTCRKLSLKHGVESTIIHNSISKLGEVVQNKLKRFKVIGTDKELTHWLIPMYGELNNNVLEWVIRPELVAAMETLYYQGNPSHKIIFEEEEEIDTIHQTPEDRSITNFSIKEYVDLLRSSKNLVLTGIIGTGKTYLAKKIAKEMQAETKLVRFHPAYSYSDFIGRQHLSNHKESLKDGDFTAFCKRALQNLLDSKKTKEELEEEKSIYETMTLFAETIRDEIFNNGFYLLCSEKNIKITDLTCSSYTVTSSTGESSIVPWADMTDKYIIYKKYSNIRWSLSKIEKLLDINNNHLFLLLFLKAFDEFQENNWVKVSVDSVKRKDFVFIIDEMNKTDISKVLGEAYAIIEPENRGSKAKTLTQYTSRLPEYDLFSTGFFIPENVYIIGTMNDIDNQNRPMSFSTIRKFTWKEIKAADRIAMWDEVIPEYKEKALNMMTTINNKIDAIPELNELYHIGPTYFLKLKNFDGNFEAFWDNYLEGILTRYLISIPNHSKIIAELKDSCRSEQHFLV